MSSTKATTTLVEQVKRQAKEAARATSISHSAALEDASRSAGFASWFALCEAHKSYLATNSETLSTLPIDPELPEHFFNTRNEDRSAEELAAWWDHPFARRREDGTFEVQCLDGGAWDRPTSYGFAMTLDEAVRIANEKLAKWRTTRAKPRILFDGVENIQVVRMPQHPHDDVEVLGSFKTIEEANGCISNLEQSKDVPPKER